MNQLTSDIIVELCVQINQLASVTSTVAQQLILSNQAQRRRCCEP